MNPTLEETVESETIVEFITYLSQIAVELAMQILSQFQYSSDKLQNLLAIDATKKLKTAKAMKSDFLEYFRTNMKGFKTLEQVEEIVIKTC
jgi:hypothetical protein